MKKALKILEWIIKENDISFISKNNLNEAIKELEEFNNRSCGNCEDFDNEMDCDSFGFCTNNENNKDYNGYDLIRTRDNFCCNKWKNKQ